MKKTKHAASIVLTAVVLAVAAAIDANKRTSPYVLPAIFAASAVLAYLCNRPRLVQVRARRRNDPRRG